MMSSVRSCGNVDTSYVYGQVDSSTCETEATSLLPSPEHDLTSMVDPLTRMFMILEKNAEKSEKLSDMANRSLNEQRFSEEQRQIDKMHEEATSILTGGFVTGALSVAEAGAMMGAGATKNCNEGLSKKYDAMAKGISSLEKATEGGFASNNKGLQATQQQFGHNAEMFKTSADDQESLRKHFEESTGKTLDHIKSFIELRQQARMAALRMA